MVTKIWACAQDLTEYAKELDKTGQKQSGEVLWEIISQLERLVDYMDDHPRR